MTKSAGGTLRVPYQLQKFFAGVADPTSQPAGRRKFHHNHPTVYPSVIMSEANTAAVQNLLGHGSPLEI
jgi:hypothetical protein